MSSIRQTSKSIILPASFVMPTSIASDPDINATIITMGAAAFDAGFTHLSDIIQGAANAEVAAVTATAAVELREKTEEYEKRCEKLRSELQKRQAALDDAWEDRRAAVAAAAAGANEEIARLREESAIAATRAHEEKRMFLKTLDDLRKEFNAAERARTERVANSSKKGAAGELALAEIIEAAAADFDATVAQMTASPESGDFHVVFNDIVPPFKILIDAKSYTRNVDHEERAKIRHDIESCPDVAAGILVSLYSGVVGAADGEIEFVNGRPLLNICKLMNAAPESRVKTLALAFSILRNHAKWGVSQHAIAAAHSKFQYYRRMLEQLQNQIGAAEKHALATLRDVANMQSSVALLQTEFIAEDSVNDAIASWLSISYEKATATDKLDIIGMYSKWIADGGRNITKAAFSAVLGAICGAESFNMTVQTGPTGNRRLVDQTILYGWRAKATVALASAIALHIYDSHTETADRKKTFTYIRKFLASKSVVGAGFIWNADIEDADVIHHRIVISDADADAMNLSLLKSWVGADAVVIADDCEPVDWKATGIVKELAGPGAKWCRRRSDVIHID